jgi:hypothetical protein
VLHAIVHPADIQDRDGGILVMANPIRVVELGMFSQPNQAFFDFAALPGTV